MIRLTKEQPQHNVFRYYLIQVVPGLFGQWGVLREWGRIGYRGTVRQDWHETEADAIQAAQAIMKDKLKRGYSAASIGIETDESVTSSH